MSAAKLLKLLEVFKDLSKPAAVKKVNPEQFSGEGLASLLNEKPLYHGSLQSDLSKMVLPDKHTQRIKVDYGGDFTKRYSPGGIYTVQNATDPRLPNYSGMGGSVYELLPSFEKTLLAGRGKMPVRDRREIQRLIEENRKFYENNSGILGSLSPRKRKNITNALYTENAFDYLLRPTYGNSILATKDFNKGLANMGYDSVLFPKKVNQGKFESGTLIGLDPNKLKITKEFDSQYFQLRAHIGRTVKDPKERKKLLNYLEKQDNELETLYRSQGDVTKSGVDSTMFKKIMRDPENEELLKTAVKLTNDRRVLDEKAPIIFKSLGLSAP